MTYSDSSTRPFSHEPHVFLNCDASCTRFIKSSARKFQTYRTSKLSPLSLHVMYVYAYVCLSIDFHQSPHAYRLLLSNRWWCTNLFSSATLQSARITDTTFYLLSSCSPKHFLKTVLFPSSSRIYGNSVFVCVGGGGRNHLLRLYSL